MVCDHAGRIAPLLEIENRKDLIAESDRQAPGPDVSRAYSAARLLRFVASRAQQSAFVRSVADVVVCALDAGTSSAPLLADFSLAQGLMQIQVGYELLYDFSQPTPMILALNIHYSRASDIVVPDHMHTQPAVSIGGYRDGFGNWCNRMVAPQGQVRIFASAVLNDSGLPDPGFVQVEQHPVQSLPEETLVFLLGSRYCETDRLSETAWKLFSHTPLGWARVQAVCDFVHQHIQFGYEHASSTKTAWQAFTEKKGVCRDFAHLAIAFCRALNIPARYCTGYLGDMGLPPPYAPMDFAAWFDVYLGGRWHSFDPRNNAPRIGRVLIARGRDAADVAFATTFGPNTLMNFRVWTEEVGHGALPT